MSVKKCIKCLVKVQQTKEPHSQDKAYGLGIRVHNERQGCTVCGASKYEDKGWCDDGVAHKMAGAKYIPSTQRHLYPPAPLKMS